jgi:putative ABC transport system permease protein
MEENGRRTYNDFEIEMSGFLRDLRCAGRMLLRSPGFAAVVIIVLALGIGANSAVFSIVNAVLLRPLPYRDPAQLYRFDETSPQGGRDGVSPADLLVFQKNTHVFEKLAVSHWQNLTLTGPEGPENTYGAKVSNDCFPMLGSLPALGRIFRNDEFQPGAPDVVLLSGRLWQRRFNSDPAVLGKQLMMNGKAHTIIGVMPREFFLDQRFELWTPWQFSAEDTARRDARTTAIVRLKPGITPQQAQAEALAVFRNSAPEDARKGWGIRLVPLAEQITQRVRAALLVSLGAVGFVLLIACLNVANLLLARASARSREIGIRTALGASRFQLVRQLLTESVLLAVLGGAAGLLLGAWGAKGLIASFPERIPVPRLDQTRIDTAVLWFTLSLSVLTGLVFGLVPALAASHTSLNEGMRQGGRGTSVGSRSRRLRSLLVIVETALSLILLVGAGLMLRSLDRLMRVNPGFDPEHVLTLRVPLPPTITEKAKQPAYYTRMIERLQTLPGVNSVGLVAPLPLADFEANATFAVEGHPPPPGERQLVKLRAVSPGYFRAMGIALRNGRVFDDSDGADAPAVAVVSERLVRKHFPKEDPIGRRITMSSEGKGPYFTIIGVAADVKYSQLGADAEPEMYRDYRQFFFVPFAMTLALRTQAADPMQLAATVQKELRAIHPDQPVSDLKAMRKVVSDNVSQPRFYTLLLAIFAAIALLLAVAGLYGVLSYSVSQRLNEIGIRVALGASRATILRLVVGEAMILVSAGVAAGLIGSFAMTRLIASQLYQTKPTDPLTFLGVSLLLFALAAAASYVPARRAMQVDPVIALRSE